MLFNMETLIFLLMCPMLQVLFALLDISKTSTNIKSNLKNILNRVYININASLSINVFPDFWIKWTVVKWSLYQILNCWKLLWCTKVSHSTCNKSLTVIDNLWPSHISVYGCLLRPQISSCNLKLIESPLHWV